MKPYAESCNENRDPILGVLKQVLAGPQQVLEIGSGTGQHAVYFAEKLPHLEWLTSDLPAQHGGIRAWVQDAGLSNVHLPLALDVKSRDWPTIEPDAVFTANTLHILDELGVEALFGGVGRLLRPEGLFIAYGPFNYGGRYTSESNARFDAWLKQRDPASGIKDADWLDRLAGDAGMQIREDIRMPVNNRIRIWVRTANPDS
jgi:cyclopropane fatty-acyl-phospholipid synthase-like methyltransferase